MKKILFLSVIGLLSFAFVVKAQDMELVRYGETGEATETMRELRVMETEEGLQERAQLMDGSGEMLQAQMQERIGTMQARKSQLRESLQSKTKLQEKRQVLEQYKGNQISEFAKGIKSRMNSQSARVDNLSKQAEGFADRMNNRIGKITDEGKRGQAIGLQDRILQSHEMLGDRLGELSELRAGLSELRENTDWDDFQNQIGDYRSVLQEIRDELKAAIAEGQELETILE